MYILRLDTPYILTTQLAAPEVVCAAKTMLALPPRTISCRWFLEYKRRRSVKFFVKEKLNAPPTPGIYMWTCGLFYLINIPMIGMIQVSPLPTSVSFSLTAQTRCQSAKVASLGLQVVTQKQ